MFDMLVLILCSILIGILILTLTSIFYLISLIFEESDDVTEDALIIDSDQFATNRQAPDYEQPDSQLQSHTKECDEFHSNNSNRLISSRRLSSEPRRLSTGRQVNVDGGSGSAISVPKPAPKQADSRTGLPAGESSLNDDDFDNPWSDTPANQKILISSRLGPIGSKQLIDDFDTNEIQLGGTGLHWCKSRKSLDRLIKLGVPLNLINNHKETALHAAIRRQKLQLVIGLLCHGAEVERMNQAGETPLISATKANDIFSTQLLLVFDANVDAQDSSGFTARHYAANMCDKHKANQQPNAAHLILMMLNEMGAKRCPVGKARGRHDQENDPLAAAGLTTRPKVAPAVACCTDGCSPIGTYDGSSFNRWPDFTKESLYRKHMFSDLIEQLKENGAEQQQQQQHKSTRMKRSRLLCLDGGGMRGVIVCQIMIEMEKYLKRPMISYFDWIGGTSVGAFLGCALSTGTSIYQLRRICFDVKDEVFSGSRPYSAKSLEKVFKRTLGSTSRLSDIKGKKVAVATVLADRDPCQLRFFRNYKSPIDLLESYGYSAEEYNNLSGHSVVLRREVPAAKADEKLKLSEKKNDVLDENERDPFVWQAVRASAAAPFFFKPYGPFLDGGIISNNPTLDMLSEFFSYESAKKFLRARLAFGVNSHAPDHDPDLRECPSTMELVVSLGTGRGRVIGRQSVIDFNHVAAGFSTVFSPVELLRSIRGARDLFKRLMQQSCHTDDHIIDRAQAWCYSLGMPYFRINPPLATIFSIDDKRDEQLIFALWQTKLYMRAMSDQLRELGDILDAQL